MCSGMVIWIINPFDDIPGEGKAQRYNTLARVLAEKGNEVVWWSSDFSHRRKVKREMPNFEMPFEFRLVSTPSYHSNVGLRRIRNHWSFGRNLIKDACRGIQSGRLKKPDVVFASMPPMEGAIAALRLRELYGCRVVTDIMDMWPNTLLQALPSSLAPLGNILLRPYRKMLRRACAESDAISAQSHAFASFAIENGASSSVYVCYLGADPSEGALRIADSEHDLLRLIYIGAMGRCYDLETIIEALCLLKKHGIGVECVFVGDGDKRSKLEMKNAQGVRFTGFLGPEDLSAELKSADLALVPLFSESGVAVPYKVGDYLAHGLPLLSTIDGELGDLIREYTCGAIYPAGDPQGLADVVRLYAQDSDRLKKEKFQAQRLFEAAFNRDKTYQEIANWLEGQAHLKV